jgi:phosphoglycerate dehydrogenase-like enzyme
MGLGELGKASLAIAQAAGLYALGMEPQRARYRRCDLLCRTETVSTAFLAQADIFVCLLPLTDQHARHFVPAIRS